MASYTVFKGSKDSTVVKSTIPKPEKLTGDQVLMRITASGLCGTDLHYVRERCTEAPHVFLADENYS